MDVVILCHTEFGFVHDRQAIPAKNAKDGVTMGVKNLADVAGKYGARVTFAVCPEVVDHFPQGLKHEIGLHIHPGWQQAEAHGFRYEVGDQYLKEHSRQSVRSTVLKDYPYEDQLDMIRTGKEHLRKSLGIEPTSFVAGRWSINNDTVRVLGETGITHECSAIPGSRRSHHDWSRLPRICMPYHPDREDYQRKGDLPLLMVPVSQMMGTLPTNPELVPQVGLGWLKACFTEYFRQSLPLFHICLHSPAMTDRYLLSAMEELLRFISKHRAINFKFASEIREYPPSAPKTRLFPYLMAVNKNVLVTAIKSGIPRAS